MLMPSSSEAPTTTSTKNVLRILSGLHAGASRALADREMILVGSGEDCDIVLADHGVARHHALINLLGDVSSLRALDAPLRVDGQPLNPGDPVELRPLQRIQVGEAAIAFGDENDAGWDALLAPGLGGAATRLKEQVRKRRLPMIAALAGLSLASLAIFAAVMPAKQQKVDPDTELKAVARQYNVGDAQVREDAGVPTLFGTVQDQATSDRIRAKLVEKGVVPALHLRTGEQIAADVGEVLRAQGLNAKTRYLGNGKVEVAGRFEDMGALRTASQSRAMTDVSGVKSVVAVNSAPQVASIPGKSTGAAGAPAAAPATVRIVAIERGKNAHLTALGGEEYQVGSQVPGLGKLLAIGETAQVIDDNGVLHKVAVTPVTAEELAAAADQQAATQAQMASAAATVAPAPAATSTTTTKSAAAAKPVASKTAASPEQLAQATSPGKKS